VLSETSEIYTNFLYSFVGITAVQVALTDFITSLGIVPDGMVGHSHGELGCAYADGGVTAEEAILVAHARAKTAVDFKLSGGQMAAVGRYTYKTIA